MRRVLLAGAVLLAGCSLVFDPSEHQRGGADGGLDAGSIDAGLSDAGSIDAGSIDAGEVDGGPVDGGPVEVEAAAFCFDYVQAYCEAQLACCSPPESIGVCTSRLLPSCADTLGEVAQDPVHGYSPTQAAQFLDEVRLAVADCAPAPDFFWQGASLRAFLGTIALGSRCQDDTSLACEGDAYCRPEVGTNRCFAAPAIDGATCRMDLDCGLDSWCDPAPLVGSACAERLDDGEGCSRSRACRSGYCDFGGAEPACATPTAATFYCDHDPFADLDVGL